ncbi:TPA: hypothetical protein ACGO10_000317 [Streptococcus suis]
MEIIAAFIGAIVAATVTFWASNQTLSDSLDSKSGWREKLFAVASKYELTLDDAQTVRTALRLFPKKGDAERYSFTWFSNIMIVHLDKYILNKDKLWVVTEEDDKSSTTNGQIKVKGLSLFEKSEATVQKSKKLNTMNSQFVRLFAMFLLKYHFDHRSAMGGKDFIFLMKGDRSRKYESIVKETCEHYEKLLGIKVKGREMTEENTSKDNSGQNESDNKGKNDCKCILKIVQPFLIGLSILFSLLLVLGIFFKYVSKADALLGMILPLILPLLAIAISILCGVLVYKKLNEKLDKDGEADIKELIAKWETIYENSPQDNNNSNEEKKGIL